MLDVLLGASGGIFGILGALFKHGIEVWQEKKKAEADLAMMQEQNRHEAVMADKQAALITLEAQNAITLAEVHKAQEVDVAAYGALAAAQASDKATFSNAPDSPIMIWVDAARGLTRPVLTAIFSLSLIGMTAWLWVKVPETVTAEPDFLKNTFFRLIDALIFLGTSACGFWFGARPTGGK